MKRLHDATVWGQIWRVAGWSFRHPGSAYRLILDGMRRAIDG